ncbi:hypothetical protein PENSPDRAFT_691957 [Peniophora sp. CONT]|nr:hypothetical protein PENSPDRAFT_691957 [Peniophora sp. CONT]
MSPLPNSTSAEAWKSFVLSRFGPPIDSSTSTQLSASRITAQLDHELEVLQHPDIIILAKRRRNASLHCCRMPPEVLSRIFGYAQEGWMPERRFPEGHVTLGWIILGHVCSQWREVALSSSSLWCDISCYALPVRAVPEFIERSRQRKLNLAFENHTSASSVLESDMANLRQMWMSQPIRQHSRKLLIRETTRRWSLRLWTSFLHAPMPSLEELKIVLYVRGSNSDIVLPDDILGSALFPPALSTLILTNCSLSWTTPLLSAKITFLDLKMEHPTQETNLPSLALFHGVLSRLTNLERLKLVNVFPVVADEGELPVLELPECLSALILDASSPSMITFGLRTLTSLTPPRRTRCSIKIRGNADTALLSAAISHLFLLPPTPPTELHLTSEMIITTASSEWISGSSKHGLKWIDRDTRFGKERRFMVKRSEANQDEVPNAHILSLLPSVRINTVERLAVATNAMQYFPDAETWKTKFVAADKVSSLALPYTPGLYHLLCALAETETNSGIEEFALFPHLATIALYQHVNGAGDPVAASDIEAAQLRLVLWNLLLARQRAGTPLTELRVENGVLGKEERQRIAEVVTLNTL